MNKLDDTKSNEDVIEIDAKIVPQSQVKECLIPDSPNEQNIEKLDVEEEEQIIEEWEPVIDEIKTKNVELKKEKKQTLQMKRELKREKTLFIKGLTA